MLPFTVNQKVLSTFPGTKEEDWTLADQLSVIHKDAFVTCIPSLFSTIIGPGANVYGPCILRNSILGGKVEVAGGSFLEKAIILDKAKVMGCVQVVNSTIKESAQIQDFATVKNTIISGNALICGQAQVEAKVSGNAVIGGYSVVLEGIWDKGGPIHVKVGNLHFSHAGPNLIYINGYRDTPKAWLEKLPSKGPLNLQLTLVDTHMAESLVRLVQEIEST